MCWMGARSRPREKFLFICTQNNSCLSPNIYFLPHSHGIWKHLQFFQSVGSSSPWLNIFLNFWKQLNALIQWQAEVLYRLFCQFVIHKYSSVAHRIWPISLHHHTGSIWSLVGWLGVFFTHFSLMFLHFHFPEMRALCISKAHARIYFSSLTLSTPDTTAVSWATLIGRIIYILWKTLVYQARQRWWQLHSL